jgi:hypothetical protein
MGMKEWTVKHKVFVFGNIFAEKSEVPESVKINLHAVFTPYYLVNITVKSLLVPSLHVLYILHCCEKEVFVLYCPH